MTKKFFPYIFPVFLIALGYLVYSHWYSPTKPLVYYPPAENRIPEHLDSLEIVNINGVKKTIHMKDAPYTLLSFVLYIPEFEDLESNYKHLADRRESYKNVRMVFLWDINEDKTIDHIKKVAQNKSLDRNILTDRMKVQYQESKNLDVVTMPSFVLYDSEGNLVYETTSPSIKELGIMLKSLR
ncbi:TlpA family protein disulfide reductase [Virgibacillus sp. DJP39]|uniref:TlpA family protein disulfide reductase n=1 Tax=Virgibacillus sp. DJP39 TaxID=3409790 RepID=UPI003BB53A17